MLPVFDFDKIKPVTMTIIAPTKLESLNLAAIFLLLPVTKRTLPKDAILQKKQKKIKLPSIMNIPGEILSMRYKKQTRGINRSKDVKSFSHSIIIDIGTRERIISMKLSKTLEFTGPTSIDLAKEIADIVIGYVKTCQEELTFIRKNKNVALTIKDNFSYYKNLENKQHLSDVETRILNFFIEKSYDSEEKFLDFIVNFDKDLYVGDFTPINFECQMANILYSLGYCIDQVKFSQIMNRSPFKCSYNNYKSASASIVYYYYVKKDKITGQLRPARHTIRVNKSGQVKHSGPNMESMKNVYYEFVKRTLQEYENIKSGENIKYTFRSNKRPREIDLDEWKNLIKEENELRTWILNSTFIQESEKRENPIFQEPSEKEYIEFNYTPLNY